MTEAAGERVGAVLETEPLVSVRAVSRTFGHGSTAVHAVREASFAIRRGDLVALVGRSGSGKTTLLNIVGGLDAPTSGEVLIGGRNVTAMPARERTELRRQTISFIFQSFGLIPMLTAAENVGIPLRIAGTARSAREERVRLMLSVVGLDAHAQQRPNELSGGQQQRVAIARALAGQPDLLIADEPTGQLDSETGRQIMRLLRTVVQSEGITALVATHDEALLELADQVLAIEDGQLTARVGPAHGDRKDPAGGRPPPSQAAADEPTRGGGVLQDHELRDLFEERAEPLRATPAPAVAAPRGRIRRRTVRIAAATGFALAVVGLVAGLLVASGLGGSGKPGGTALQAHGSAYPAPPGQPYVFVNSSAMFVNVGNVPATPAELRNAATGKVVKVLLPVRRGVSFSAAAAAPGDRLFVLAQQDSDGTLSFAEIQIGASGKPDALRQVLPDLPASPGVQVVSMVVNAPGTRLSFTTAASEYGPSGPSGSLVVYNLQTGTLIGSWPIAFETGASSQFLGHGNNLVASIGTGHNRLVDTTTPFRPGSSLLADSRPYGVVGAFATLTQDGNIGMDAVGNQDRALLVEYSAASGKVLRNIPIGSAEEGPNFCGVLWASANGHEVWTQCGTRQLVIVGGHATQIRLAWLVPTNAASGASVFAW